MTLVVDASIAATWVLVDEQSPASDLILDRVDALGGHVPPLFWHEIQNILLLVERRGRGLPAETAKALRRLRGLDLKVISRHDDASLLSLARRHKLTAYDTAYLDLALVLTLPIATMDRQLATAARHEGVSTVGPLAP